MPGTLMCTGQRVRIDHSCKHLVCLVGLLFLYIITYLYMLTSVCGFVSWSSNSWQTFEETSGYVRPERVNKWPNSMTDIWWWWWWWWWRFYFTNNTCKHLILLIPCTVFVITYVHQHKHTIKYYLFIINRHTCCSDKSQSSTKRQYKEMYNITTSLLHVHS